MNVIHKDQKSLNLYRTKYKQDDCKIGIVHVGYGAFHRAHQSIYIDDYMEKTGDLRWGIAAVNLRSTDALTFARSSQIADGYLVKTTDVNGELALRQVRSHIGFFDWSSAPDATEDLISSVDVSLVTITVTESGYHLNSEGELDLSDDLIASEIANAEAQTIYGYLANSLNKRMMAIDQPISILCCDNIRSNGKMLRANFLTYLKSAGREALADWVVKNVSFPCSMVDRITPRATLELIDEVTGLFGQSHLDPIHAEAFTQWVLEDNFASTMPDLKQSGVEVVSDVDPYEEAKIRILNGGHTGLAYFGALAGYSTFDEAMFDPALRQFFDNFETKEVLPGLQIDLPFNKAEYLQKIADRFCNSAIADQLERICMDGYSKMQLYIRPTLESCLRQDIEPVHTIDCIASWYVYARRFKQGKTAITYHEPYWEQLSPMLDTDKEDVFANNGQLWGELPKTYSTFSPILIEAIKRMENSWPA